MDDVKRPYLKGKLVEISKQTNLVRSYTFVRQATKLYSNLHEIIGCVYRRVND